MIMRSIILSIALLLSALNFTLAQGNLYDEFLPSSEPNELEWTVGDLTPTNVDPLDISLFEYPIELQDESPTLDLAKTNDGCSSAGVAMPDILKPRGDDECAVPAPQEEPLVFPNLGTLQVDQICPSKYWITSPIPVCASAVPGDADVSGLGTATLKNCQLGGFSPCVIDRSWCISNEG